MSRVLTIGPFEIHTGRPMLDAINRRVAVENALLRAAKGTTTLPDAETCRSLALHLGTPREAPSGFRYRACPHCASRPSQTVSARGTAGVQHWVACVNCGAQGPVGKSAELAISLWNGVLYG